MKNFLFTLIAVTLLPLVVNAQYSAFDDPPSAGGPGGAAVSNQEISTSKPEVDGGEIAAGQTASVIVLLRNNASTPITLDRIEMAPSSNITAEIANNQCAQAPIKPGVECAVTVSIKGDSTGKFRLGLLIYHSGKTQLSNVFVTGTVGGGRAGGASGLPANEIEAFPIALDFGNAKGSTPLVRSIALRNSSSNTVTINSVELAASALTGFVVDAPSCKELQASQACVATVTWSPTTEGTAEGVLILRHSGPSGSLQIPLKGVYELAKTNKAELFPSAVAGAGLLVADREGVEFGSSIDGAASITVSLVNNGDKDVTLSQVKLAGSDNGLSLSTDGCSTGRVLAPRQGCALTVNWAPRRAGPVIDDIQIIHDGARGVLVLPVRGTATAAASGSLPMMNAISTLPKMSSGAIDEKLVGGASGGGEVNFGDAGGSSLNGYRVTSLSGNRAIIAGPRGRVLVTAGERQMIGGGYWKPVITYDGVKLVGAKDTVMLFFDRTMTVGTSNGTNKAMPSSSGGAGTVTTGSGAASP